MSSFVILLLVFLTSIKSNPLQEVLKNARNMRDGFLQVHHTSKQGSKIQTLQTDCEALLTQAKTDCSSYINIRNLVDNDSTNSTCYNNKDKTACCGAQCSWNGFKCQKIATYTIAQSDVQALCTSCLQFVATYGAEFVTCHEDAASSDNGIKVMLELIDMKAGEIGQYCLKDLDGTYCLPQALEMSKVDSQCNVSCAASSTEYLDKICTPCSKLWLSSPESNAHGHELLCTKDNGQYCAQEYADVMGLCTTNSGFDPQIYIGTTEGYTKACGNRCFSKMLTFIALDGKSKEGKSGSSQNKLEILDVGNDKQKIQSELATYDLICPFPQNGSSCFSYFNSLLQDSECTVCSANCCKACNTGDCASTSGCLTADNECIFYPDCTSAQAAFNQAGCCGGNFVEFLQLTNLPIYTGFSMFMSACNIAIPSTCSLQSTEVVEIVFHLSWDVLQSDVSTYREMAQNDVQLFLGCQNCVSDLTLSQSSTYTKASITLAAQDQSTLATLSSALKSGDKTIFQSVLFKYTQDTVKAIIGDVEAACQAVIAEAMTKCSSYIELLKIVLSAEEDTTCKNKHSKTDCCQASCSWNGFQCRPIHSYNLTQSHFSSYCGDCLTFIGTYGKDFHSCIDNTNITLKSIDLLLKSSVKVLAQYCMKDNAGTFCAPSIFEMAKFDNMCKYECAANSTEFLNSLCVQCNKVYMDSGSMELLCTKEGSNYCAPGFVDVLGLCSEGDNNVDIIKYMSTSSGYNTMCGNRCYSKMRISTLHEDMRKAEDIQNMTLKESSKNQIEAQMQVMDIMCSPAPNGGSCLSHMKNILEPFNCTACSKDCCYLCGSSDCAAMAECELNSDNECERKSISCASLKEVLEAGCCSGNFLKFIQVSDPSSTSQIQTLATSCNLTMPTECERSRTAVVTKQTKLDWEVIQKNVSKYEELAKNDMNNFLGCQDCVTSVKLTKTTKSGKVNTQAEDVTATATISAQDDTTLNTLKSSLETTSDVELISVVTTAQEDAVSTIIDNKTVTSPTAPTDSPSATSPSSTSPSSSSSSPSPSSNIDSPSTSAAQCFKYSPFVVLLFICFEIAFGF